MVKRARNGDPAPDRRSKPLEPPTDGRFKGGLPLLPTDSNEQHPGRYCAVCGLLFSDQRPLYKHRKWGCDKTKHWKQQLESHGRSLYLKQGETPIGVSICRNWHEQTLANRHEDRFRPRAEYRGGQDKAIWGNLRMQVKCAYRRKTGKEITNPADYSLVTKEHLEGVDAAPGLYERWRVMEDEHAPKQELRTRHIGKQRV